jgi:lipoprotein signal peptidase
LSSDPSTYSGPAGTDATTTAGARNPPPDHATQLPATALRDLRAHLRLWLVVASGLTLDLWSKQWAFHTLGQGGHRTLIPSVLEFHTTLNPGALFGIGAGRTGVFLLASVLALVLVVWMFAQSPPRRWLTHVALGAILAGALGNMYDRAFVDLVEYVVPAPGGRALRYFVEERSPDGGQILLYEYPPMADQPPLKVPAALAERLTEPVGYVRDFIKIPTRWLGGRDLWPWIFNVADMFLVGGVAILAVRLLRDRKSHGGAAPGEAGGEV